jgi:hypothetical protein
LQCTSACLLCANSGHRTPSFNHLVRASLHRRRHVDAECLGRREIDGQYKLGRLHDWQFGRFFALENPAGINTGQAVAVNKCPIRSSSDRQPQERYDTDRSQAQRGELSGQPAC